MDALTLFPIPSSSRFLAPSPGTRKTLSPHPRPHLPSSTSSASHPTRRNLKLRVSTSDSPSVAVPAGKPESDSISAVESSGDRFDWYSQWYPVAPVCDLDKRAPRAVTVLGIDLVVWWDREKERWRVFEDRCAHRLAPLSEGRIDRWGRLQCVYHGWCFDGSGSCKLIPQAPFDGPPVHTSSKACVATYPCYVQNNIVWFWPRTESQHKDIPGECKPPNIPEIDDPSYTCTMGIRDIPYGYEVLIENLMDPAHVPYAHHKIMRIPKRPPSLTRDREGGIPVDIRIENLDITGFLAKQQFGYGKFVAPCLYYAFFPSTGLSNGSASSSNNQTMPPPTFLQKQRRFLLVFYCIPVSPGKSRLIWVFPRNFSVWVDQIVPRWMFHVGQNLILDSDLYLLHVEERKIAEVGNSNWQKACFVPTKSDGMVTAFRRWMKRYANDRVDWGNKFAGFLPPSPPREQLLDRYWSHVVHCRSCSSALKGMRALEAALPVVSLALIGAVAAAKQTLMTPATRIAVVSTAVFCFAASKWLSHFIHKIFYFHDYNHAFK
ncbi:Protochlorophyllide-dependent translocon component 52, chloroplastic [Apostasia shenzhenica]|uniref:Protochlorophyllide-dependent translocon component 52, chloroplastic n=1 Tax=Apostasia shenzhenica TaxID=1088818 RepID=A0A2I0AAG1_9ASPA|nr:Protochlorophyllide-dependent translocon component 52, chloroplastic [Apostasia shenzhenica]